MVLYVKELDAGEQRRLRELAHCDDADLQRRAQVILLSAEGYRIPEIAQILGVNPANLRKWIHRYNRQGWQGLLSVRSGGAKPRFSEAQKAQIVALARTRPRDLGLHFTSWTLHKLVAYARQQRIVESISHECIRQMLKAAGCGYKHDLQPSEHDGSDPI